MVNEHSLNDHFAFGTTSGCVNNDGKCILGLLRANGAIIKQMCTSVIANTVKSLINNI